jgi:hypothetical protein
MILERYQFPLLLFLSPLFLHSTCSVFVQRSLTS